MGVDTVISQAAPTQTKSLMARGSKSHGSKRPAARLANPNLPANTPPTTAMPPQSLSSLQQALLPSEPSGSKKTKRQSVYDATHIMATASSETRDRTLEQIVANGGRIIGLSVVTQASKNAIFLAVLAVINFAFTTSLSIVSICVMIGGVDISLKVYGFVIALIILILITVITAYGVYSLYRSDIDLSPWHKMRLATSYIVTLVLYVLLIITLTVYIKTVSTTIVRDNASDFVSLAVVLQIPVIALFILSRELVPTIMCARYQEGRLPRSFIVRVNEFDSEVLKMLREAKINDETGATYV